MNRQASYLGDINRMARSTGKSMAGGVVRRGGVMTDNDRVRMQQMAPRPTLGQRVKRMTEWFSGWGRK